MFIYYSINYINEINDKQYFLNPLQTFNLLLNSLCQEDIYDDNVFVLQKADNIKDYISELSKDKYLVIKFYSPNCGHCKSLAPKYNNLAYVYKNQDKYIYESNGSSIQIHKNVLISEINCLELKQMCRQEQIMGYPTVRLYRYGEAIDQLAGKRNVDNLVTFIENNIQLTEEALEELKQEYSEEEQVKEQPSTEQPKQSYSWAKQPEL